jgi:hypothetical protein
MHAALLALLIVAGAEEVPAPAWTDQPEAALPAMYSSECGSCCDAEACGGGMGSVHRCCLLDWFGPMPQTCYSPRFGCYPGNGRDIHRYPAFHGYYYRKPYNYRHYFEYPWHAEPHEPLGYSVRQSFLADP